MGKGGGECATRQAMDVTGAADDVLLDGADRDQRDDGQPHRWLERTYRPDELPDVGPYGGSLDAAANTYWAAGGCVHLALAFVSLYPQLKIAVDWYSDHGRKAVAHAVAYDPDSGRCFDIYGTRQLSWALPTDTSSIGVQTDVDPVAVAEHMQITDPFGRPWSPDQPWAVDEVMEACELIDEMFPPRPHNSISTASSGSGSGGG